MKILAACFCLCAMPLLSQSNSGELHLKVIDPSGRGVRSVVTIVSQANQYRNTLATGDQGTLDVRRLPYGIYEIEIQQPGFAAVSTSVGIHSSLPAEET
ncbi:MAG: carboxypeptidase-like regulatory domain-containing protein, partial [Silvibacterium sp.]